MAPRNVLVVVLLALCCADKFQESNAFGTLLSNSIVLGTKAADDAVLTQFDLDETAILGSQLTIKFPSTSETNTKAITYIKITDRFGNGINATPTRIDGGVGQTFFTVTLKYAPLSPNLGCSVLIFGK